MYLALQHGLKVANYPLVDEDFDVGRPPAARSGAWSTKCFGLLSTAARLSQVRGERRPGSVYASLAPVQLRAAPGRGALPGTPVPVHQLGLDVGGGDGGRHHAEHQPQRAPLTVPGTCSNL